VAASFGRQANFQNVDVTFDPEYVENIEIGFKGSLLDGAMTLNAAYFYE
jgi:outer membrane receptor protein involved in Fe transport